MDEIHLSIDEFEMNYFQKKFFLTIGNLLRPISLIKFFS